MREMDVFCIGMNLVVSLLPGNSFIIRFTLLSYCMYPDRTSWIESSSSQNRGKRRVRQNDYELWCIYYNIIHQTNNHHGNMTFRWILQTHKTKCLEGEITLYISNESPITPRWEIEIQHPFKSLLSNFCEIQKNVSLLKWKRLFRRFKTRRYIINVQIRCV